jgi:hypothetical protein
MMLKKATAYKIGGRVIIMPVFQIPDLYPVSGDPVYDGPITCHTIEDDLIQALNISQIVPPDFEFDKTSKHFLKSVKFKSLKAFHAVADSVSVEAVPSADGEIIRFFPLARAECGGFAASTVEPLIASADDLEAVRSTFVAALDLSMLAEPKPKPILPLKSKRRKHPLNYN